MSGKLKDIREILYPAGDPLIPKVKVGTIGDYTEILADGTVIYKGQAVVYDDEATSLIGSRLYTSVGKIDFDYDENGLIFQPGGDIANKNDRALMSPQTKHAKQFDTPLFPHLHFIQDVNTEREFTLQYRINGNGLVNPTVWTTITANTLTDCKFVFQAGIMNILIFPEIPTIGKGISAIVDFRLARTDSNTGDVLGKFFDFHYIRDMDGSNGEYNKF